jgi:hypothetical protein
LTVNEAQDRAIRRGRNCNVCTSVFRQDIESLLAAGGTFAEARRISHIFEESISRHWENHVAPVVRDRYRSGNSLTAVTIASRMVELLEAAKEIRLRAGAKGRDATALRAVAVEADLVSKMADRLGVDQGQSLPELAELVALRAAVGAVARTNPDAAERVALQVELTHPTVAAAIRLQFLETKEVSA